MDLQTKLAEFQKNYGVEVNFDQLAREVDASIRFRRVNNFFSFRRSREVTPEKDNYFTGLMILLKRHVNTQVHISEDRGAAYTMREFDIAKFIYDYEELVGLHNQATNGAERQPLAGITEKTLLKNVVRNSASVDKPMYMFWAERMAKGEMSMETLRNITNNASGALRNKTNWTGENDLGDDGRSLTNVVMAQQAMRALNNKRGFIWILRNFSQWRQEKAYLAELNEQIQRYRKNGLPVEGYIEGCNTTILNTAREKSQRNVQMMEKGEYPGSLLDPKKYQSPRKMFEIIEEMNKKDNELLMGNNQKEEKKDIIKENNAKQTKEEKPSIKAEEKYNEITSAPDFKENFKKELLDIIPNANSNQFAKLFVETTMTGLKVKLPKFAQAFDQAESNFKEHLHNCAKAVFQEGIMLMSMLGIQDDVERILTAQIITDKVMKTLSPVIVNPEAYDEFANGYAFKHVDEFNEYLKNSKVTENVQDVYEQAQQKYSRTNISLEDELKHNEDIVPAVKKEANVNVLNKTYEV
ncbi:MAG: hypothetical protein J6S04_04965 [Clostridia bacterium]|nr:hypothetical protein [Clostridia bacterium]